ncbi:unnamed protein product [Oikopleura dioica]|uniref:non-specific serine/threonine protein kinase n=1 Tax=Oikopleura dioica TaxID=34765 RepID=E4WXD4_OIKDI|nr:unnamed protein product [Oikopleura dioica]
MKVVHTDGMSQTERMQALNEANVLKVLQHPNIIRYIQNFENEGNLHLMMEYADDGSLDRHVRKHKELYIGCQQTQRKFSQIVSGLAFMHKTKIMHRDLKPQNIFLTKHGYIKIGDLGIAKFTSTHATGTQTMVGTATYVAPEVCDSQKYGMKSDIWSLGCVLYEMCALERAFGGHNAIAIIKKISEANYKKLKEDLPYSTILRRLINSLLQKNPRERPSADELDEIHLPKILESINSKRKRIDDLLLSNDHYEDYHSHLFTFSADQWSMQFKRGLPKGLNIMDIGSGDRHTLILDVNNVVYGVGSNDLGQLGFGSQMPRIENPEPVKFSTNRPVQAIGTGADFSVFLMNKMVFTCGNGENGCLGHGSEHKSSMFPNMVQDLISYDVVKISAGYKHVLALTSDGNVYSWGCGELGRLGHGGQGSEFSPKKITSLQEKIKEIYAGYDSSFFIGISGNMYVCGSNRDNKIGLQKRSMLDIFRLGHSRIPPYKDTPILSRQLNSNQTISKISQSRDHTVVLTSTGKEDSRFIITSQLFTMGRNSEGQRGLENSRSMIDCSPIQIPKIDGKNVQSITHIATGSFMTCIAAKIGSDRENEPEEQVVLFTGTSFLPHGSKPGSAKPRLTSERSLRLDIATLEAAIQDAELNLSETSTNHESSIPEEDMYLLENESKKLRAPTDRKAIRRNLYNGEIYLDKKIKIQSIGFCHTDQTFFITLGMKESPDSLSHYSSRPTSTESAIAPLKIPILNEQNLSEDDDEDHPTWLRNELEGAPDIRLLTIQKDGSAEGLKRECTLITTRRLKKSKMSKKSNIPKPTRSVAGPKSKQQYFQARGGSAKKSQKDEEMKLLVTSLQLERDEALERAEKLEEEQKREKERIEEEFEKQRQENEKLRKDLQRLEELQLEFKETLQNGSLVRESKVCSIM